MCVHMYICSHNPPTIHPLFHPLHTFHTQLRFRRFLSAVGWFDCHMFPDLRVIKRFWGMLRDERRRTKKYGLLCGGAHTLTHTTNDHIAKDNSILFTEHHKFAIFFWSLRWQKSTNGGSARARKWKISRYATKSHSRFLCTVKQVCYDGRKAPMLWSWHDVLDHRFNETSFRRRSLVDRTSIHFKTVWILQSLRLRSR